MKKLLFAGFITLSVCACGEATEHEDDNNQTEKTQDDKEAEEAVDALHVL